MNKFGELHQPSSDPIDFVVTWVDSADPEWRADLERFSPKQETSSNNPARFRDLGTLKYVFRGIEKFAPWVNKVHLITAGHVPSWLNKNNQKLNLLTHRDIFLDKSHLPIFNSSAIEMNFLGIKELTERFVIFNDDTLILKPIDRETFFKNDLPCDFLIQTPIKGLLAPFIYRHEMWLRNISNNVDLICREFYLYLFISGITFAMCLAYLGYESVYRSK